MCKKKEGNTYAIILNGEIYNMKMLKEQLIKEGEMFSTTSDTEVVLTGYIRYGISYIEELNGIFSIALWDGTEEIIFDQRSCWCEAVILYKTRRYINLCI